MQINDMSQLLKHELGDLLYAEKQILKALKKMTKEVNDPEVKERLLAHHDETEQHVENLNQAFEAIDMKPKAQKCDGILGIIEEHDAFKEDEPAPEMLEAFNLGSGLRVEHYEISAYRSAIAVAKTLGETQVVELLTKNLDQELAMAKFLEGAAPKALRTLHRATSGDTAMQSSPSDERGAAKRAPAKKTSTNTRGETTASPF